MDIKIAIILIIVAAVVFAILGFIAGQIYRKKVAEAAIGSANQEATRIINAAMTTAEQKKKEAILEAKDEIHKQRSETERDLRERRSEVQRQERRIIQKEEAIDKKVDTLERKEEVLNQKIRNVDEKLEEVDTVKKSQLEMLEKISGYSKEQAKAPFRGFILHHLGFMNTEFIRTVGTIQRFSMIKEFII